VVMYQLLEFKYMSTYSVNDKHKCGMGEKEKKEREKQKLTPHYCSISVLHTDNVLNS